MLRKAATGNVEGLSATPFPSSSHVVVHPPRIRTGPKSSSNKASCISQFFRKLERIGCSMKEHRTISSCLLRSLLPLLPLVALLLVVGFFSSPGTLYLSKSDGNFHRSFTQQLLTVPQVTLPEFPFGAIDCRVSTDIRGNLGPASVLLSNRTEDWIRDRWQAASDMHGTNIQGQHFVQFTWTMNASASTSALRLKQKLRASFPVETPIEPMIVAQRMELDWEAAYSDNYDIQIRNASRAEDSWKTIFSMRPIKAAGSRNRTTTGGSVVVSQWGQSPGVTNPTPLHVLHNITLHDPSAAASQLRILIHTSAMGWGVSLWQVKVFGYYIIPLGG